MLKGAELTMRQRENGLADEKQELAQLEEMYKGTHLATETKDIVLDRTRRNVKLQEQWLEISKDGNTVSMQFRYPQRDQDVRDTLRWAQQDDAHTRLNDALQISARRWTWKSPSAASEMPKNASPSSNSTSNGSSSKRPRTAS
jgi:hypothetical protein